MGKVKKAEREEMEWREGHPTSSLRPHLRREIEQEQYLVSEILVTRRPWFIA